jgi:hypothetical protein
MRRVKRKCQRCGESRTFIEQLTMFDTHATSKLVTEAVCAVPLNGATQPCIAAPEPRKKSRYAGLRR